MLFQKPIYKRVLLKLSGEALLGDTRAGIDPAVLTRIANEIATLIKHHIQVGIVIGGGNLFRGASLATVGISRITGDQMGMLGTVMNGLALRDALVKLQINTRILSAIEVTGIADAFDRLKAIYYLENGHVVIFTGGTGNPLFTTDSAASLRGIEVDANAILKATKVDGVYEADPVTNPNAQRYETLSYQEVIAKDLAVMDVAAISLCRDHHIPIHVFNMNKHGAILDVVMGHHEGTIIR